MVNGKYSKTCQLTTNKTKPVPNGKMARIMTHCQPAVEIFIRLAK